MIETDNVKIGGLNKLKYAIIGYPVAHSLSPEMHEAGFKTAGIDATYERITIHPLELTAGISDLKANHFNGFNVTYPLKEKIIPFLDGLTSEAQAIGAVNTVKIENGLLYGHNTDGQGFVEALRRQDFDFNSKKVVILGAGGAAKAIAVSLACLNVYLLILNRTSEKAAALAEQVNLLGGKASGDILAPGTWLESVDLLVQTTSVGMKSEPYLFDLQGINPAAWAVDLIYNPAVTSLLSNAALHGCRTFNGLDMLLFQGVLAWDFWFGVKAPVDSMRKALVDKLSVCSE